MTVGTFWRQAVTGKNGMVGRWIAKSTDRRRRQWMALRSMVVRRQLAERQAAMVELEEIAGPCLERHLGFLTVPPPTFPEVGEIVHLTRQALANAETRGGRKDQLITNLLDSRTLSLDSAYIRFALRPEIVACLSRYFGLVPILTAVDCWHSKPSRSLANSQLFHCDWHDLSQVRIYVHASDVSSEDGPLVVVDATRSAGIRDRHRYRFGGALSDDTIAASVGTQDWHILTGPTGQITMVDTARCFHQGSRISLDGHSRAIAMMQFVSPTAFFLPSKREGGAPFSRLADLSLPRWQRLVLGG